MTINETVNRWFGERLASGALARDTAAYNQVVGALPDLIARLTPPVVAAEPLAEPELASAEPPAAPVYHAV